MPRYLRLGKETSFGSLAASFSRWLPILSESLELTRDVEYEESVAYRAPMMAFRKGEIVEGDIEYYPAYGDIGELLHAFFGQVTTSQPDGVNAPNTYQHEFTPADAMSISYSIEVGLDTVTAKQVLGAAVNELNFAVEGPGPLKLTAGILGQKLQTGSLASGPTYEAEKILGSQATAYLGDKETDPTSPIQILSLELVLNNNFADDVFEVGSYNIPALIPKTLEISGRFSARFADSAKLTDFLNATEKALKIKFSNGLIESTYNYELEIVLPRINYDAFSAEINGQDLIVEDVEFTALKPASGTVLDPIKVILQNKVTSY